ncbi:MAG: dihydropteroate synthase [Pedosphaera sp.]|nr:dihydropteroate synthase [Pedosphaera sp.]
MGILNVTPDSFSDGGQFLDVERAVARAEEMVAEGAELIDVGGESTRPGAVPLSESEELRRVLPVVRRLCSRIAVAVSVDTRKAAVARAVLDAGASMINDIEATRLNPEMWRVVAEFGAGYCAMHMQGTPETMQINPVYEDVVSEIGSFFEDRLDRLSEVGVRSERVLLDPGIGFGKTLEQTLALLRGIPQFSRSGRPILLGISRKSFMGKALGIKLENRLPATLACSLWAAARGVSFFRTHDVAATVQALRLHALLGDQLR